MSTDMSTEPTAPAIALPPGLDPDDPRAQAIVMFNRRALDFAARIGEDDRRTRHARWWVMTALAAVLAVGTLLVVARIATSDNLGSAIAASVAVVSVLAVAGLVNPLQTIERDIVVRRWSDMIIASFFLQAGDENATLTELRRTTRRASQDFAALASSYGRISARTLKSLETLARDADTADAAGQPAAPATAPPASALTPPVTAPAPAPGPEVAAEARTVSVTSPGRQESRTGVAVEGVRVAATGPGELTWSAAGLPTGLAIDPASGSITGTPARAARKAAVTVTVTSSDDAAGGATVSFAWVVSGSSSPSTPPA